MIQDTDQSPYFRSRRRAIASTIVWPALMAASLILTALGFNAGFDGESVVFVVYLLLALAIGLLERLMPHEPQWRASDGQVGNDLLHTIIGSAAPEFLARLLVMLLFAELAGDLAARFPPSPWPSGWFFPAQIFLALFVADFGLYWAHRLAHETMLLWRLHALHHSPERLYFFNTGRFHFLDTFKSVILGLPLLIILGPPQDVILWYIAFYNYVGLLTHCNIEIRRSIFDYIFNTPGVHRWHHSRVTDESKHNYGEILVLWDHIFGTHFLPRRRPPADIGIDYQVPSGFVAQLALPFTLKIDN